MQTVRYLLSYPKIIEEANSQNDLGFTALDIIEHTPKDFKSLEIQLMLTEIGIKSKKNVQENHLPPQPSTTVYGVLEMTPSKENCWIKFKNWGKISFSVRIIGWKRGEKH